MPFRESPRSDLEPTLLSITFTLPADSHHIAIPTCVAPTAESFEPIISNGVPGLPDIDLSGFQGASIDHFPNTLAFLVEIEDLNQVGIGPRQLTVTHRISVQLRTRNVFRLRSV